MVSSLFPWGSSIIHEDEVRNIKEKLFSNADPYSLVSPSAYGTAWQAMVPNYGQPMPGPLFANCLLWVLHNQNEEGFWGDCDGHGNPTVECLPATLACVIALRRWNMGNPNVEKGLAFIYNNAEKLLGEMDKCPRWFSIVFPGMIEHAKAIGLENFLPDSSQELVKDLYWNRQQILDKEELVDEHHYPPLLSYLEALPSSHAFDEEDIIHNLSSDGSLFQSPSATACAFMITRKKECMIYLQSLLGRCPESVPCTYPMDEELIRLCMLNQIQRLGLAEPFHEEIEEVLVQVFRNYTSHGEKRKPSQSFSTQLFKDSLAFWLLRMHGYDVSPRSFCWFLQEEAIVNYLEKNHECFAELLLTIYRATDIMFSEECDFQEARSFARKLLEKTLVMGPTSKTSKRMIEHELSVLWFSRLDHLERRRWIEEPDNNILWMEKAFPLRLSLAHSEKLLQLSMRNYERRQLQYQKELEELKQWSKRTGLSNMGFGREKTTYCYFASAAGFSLSWNNSDVRMTSAKGGIIITVADDFFDMKGSMNELKCLADAIQRWDGKGLTGDSKTIFDALDDLISEIWERHLKPKGYDAVNMLRDIWRETFNAWLTEAKWSRSGSIPSMDEYLAVGMTSIATHTLVLQSSLLLDLSLPSPQLKPPQYPPITRLLMVTTRLLNEIQSYTKEQAEGKPNYVLLYMIENPDAHVEDSIAHVKEILEIKKKELVEHVLNEGLSSLPRPIRDLHFSCFRVFHMFYNSSNRFDSKTDMLQDIAEAIHIPIDVPVSRKTEKRETLQHSSILKPKGAVCPLEHFLVPHCSSESKKKLAMKRVHCFDRGGKQFSMRSYGKFQGFCPIPRDRHGNKLMQPNFRPCFI